MADPRNYFNFVQGPQRLLKLMPEVHISAGVLEVHSFLLVPLLLADEPLDALLLERAEIPQYDLCRGVVDPAPVGRLSKGRETCLMSRQ